MNRTWLMTAAVMVAALMTMACSDDGGTSSDSTSSSSSSTSGGGGAGGDGGDGGSTGGAGGAGGMAEQMIHGCLSTTADDETEQFQVIFEWDLPHSRCVLTTTETLLVWSGDFTLHPITGGIADGGMATPDPSSPASMLDQSGPTAATTITSPGVYPFYCENHPDTMNGVIYVQAAGAGGAGGAGGSM